jgi:hypothetical protein
MNPIPFQSIPKAQNLHLPRSRNAPVLPQGDIRWVLAARACLAADGPAQIQPHDRQRLQAWAVRQGIAPIHAAAIIGMGEMAAARGGLSRDDAERIATLPEPAKARVHADLGRILLGVIVLFGSIAAAFAAARWF